MTTVEQTYATQFFEAEQRKKLPDYYKLLRITDQLITYFASKAQAAGEASTAAGIYDEARELVVAHEMTSEEALEWAYRETEYLRARGLPASLFE
jgi:hypothetical protein